jgi:hypothetical protein
MKKLSQETIKHEIKIGILQAKQLVRLQSKEINERQFISNVILLQETSEVFSDLAHNEYWLEWIEEQLENKLPNLSSGSFMTALLDVDALLTGIGMEEDIYTEEEHQEMVDYHTELYKKYIK